MYVYINTYILDSASERLRSDFRLICVLAVVGMLVFLHISQPSGRWRVAVVDATSRGA